MEGQVEGEAVKRDVLLAFEYAHNEEDWVNPVATALSGVTADEAAWTPDPDVRSIWEIVLHMAIWTENIVQRQEQRTRGELPGHPSEGAWLPLPAILSATAWGEAQQRLWNALNAMRDQIKATPLSAMLDFGNAGYSQFADLLCRFTHNAYHLGQITKLRECRANSTAVPDTSG